MSLTLKLSDKQATLLQAKAAAEGLSLDEWIEKLAQPDQQPTMRREGLTHVLTNDKHFEQEGFHALFREQPQS
jgi:hypothetical protein